MNNVSILIADDEEELLNQLVIYTNLFCDTVYKATNGKEALELYYKHKPNIIITDINMPKISGLELIEKIRETDQETEIIILSAHKNTEYLLKAVKLHLISYLLKPITIDELKDTITQAINRIKQKGRLYLNNGYYWDDKNRALLYNNTKIDLTNYELLLIESLIQKQNCNVSLEELHYEIYSLKEFSKDAITSLVKRIRQKTTKELIKSSYKEGYKLEILSK